MGSVTSLCCSDPSKAECTISSMGGKFRLGSLLEESPPNPTNANCTASDTNHRIKASTISYRAVGNSLGNPITQPSMIVCFSVGIPEGNGITLHIEFNSSHFTDVRMSDQTIAI